MGAQCDRTHKRIAELVADRKNEKYAVAHQDKAQVFLLTSLLITISGARGKGSRSWIADSFLNLSFNLVP